nr:unnamed protein product [Digitaria exilis]
MGSVSAAVGWTAEDDVLLKNAVEAGASLESLAKGAVCFSRKFTLEELQDRWFSLLYDSETSAQASARMANYEMELSVSDPAKAMKLFKPKAKFYMSVVEPKAIMLSDDQKMKTSVSDAHAFQILDQDLIPWDQEPIIQPEVSRFQYPEKRKDLIRLEKGSCSYMNRSIMFNGAFAVLYGQHLKCYIRDPEVLPDPRQMQVTLGRQTKEVNVDIDLGKEGNANKISRRQIRNMKFIFHVNHNAVQKYITRTRSESSRGKFTAFDWNRSP